MKNKTKTNLSWTVDSRFCDHGRSHSATTENGLRIVIEQRRSLAGERGHRGYSNHFEWIHIYNAEGGPSIAHKTLTGRERYLSSKDVRALALNIAKSI